MSWQQSVEQTVVGLGFEMVDLERSAGGLLRVSIDTPFDPTRLHVAVTVDDCERVTRQLQYLLEVEGLDYRRLEVGSPGIDRPLRHEADYARFAGAVVDLTLKAPIGEAAGGMVAANRKKFRGTLERAPEGAGWQLVWREEPPAGKPGRRVSKKVLEALPTHVLGFTLEEVREARLAPIVNFKGRAADPEDFGQPGQGQVTETEEGGQIR